MHSEPGDSRALTVSPKALTFIDGIVLDDGPLSGADWAALGRAHDRLEHPGLAARLSDLLGTPIERARALLPARWQRRVDDASQRAIRRALDLSIRSLRPEEMGRPRDGYHRALSGVTGAAGGFFGLPALMVELPVTTALMLRAIAHIAREEGEVLDSLEARLACVEVFALGGRSPKDDAAETGYWGVRLAVAAAVREAQAHVLKHGVSAGGGPAIARAVAAIAARFGVALSQKTAAQFVPVVGAAGGAMVNLAFMRHFQEMARSHFTVRRLERRYGAEIVRDAYDRLSAAEARDTA